MSNDYEYDLFLSHNAADKPWAEKLASAIEADKDGRPLRVFFDEWDMPAGSDIPKEIEAALQASRHIGLVLSPDSLSSRWVSLERSAAVARDPDARGRTLIPLLLRDCDVPVTLSRLKHIDFRKDGDFESSSSALAAQLRGKALRRGSRGWSSEELDNMHDLDMLNKQIVAFNRPAFRQPCILELYIPELSEAIDDTQAALNTGTLNSRSGRHLGTLPPVREYRTPQFKGAFEKVLKLLSELKLRVSRLVEDCRETVPYFGKTDFGRAMYELSEEFQRRGREEGLATTIRRVISAMDEIDEKRNQIIGILDSLLEMSGGQRLGAMPLSSEVIRVNEYGLTEQIRERMGAALLVELGLYGEHGRRGR